MDRAYDKGTIPKSIWKYIKKTLNPKHLHFMDCLNYIKSQKPLRVDRSSQGGSLTENGSQIVEATLKPYVRTLFSYIKDTLHFLETIDGLNITNQCLFGNH